jgi:hypothetical protein
MVFFGFGRLVRYASGRVHHAAATRAVHYCDGGQMPCQPAGLVYNKLISNELKLQTKALTSLFG